MPSSALGPFTIDGKTYLTLKHASRIIGAGVSGPTLHRWARMGHTPFDFDLDVVRQPITTHAHQETETWLQFRLLISEECTLLLKQLLQDHRQNPNRPMRLTNRELADLKAASARYRL